MSDLQAIRLTCNGQTDPLAVHDLPPRLSWQIASKVRNVTQGAYQIQAASSPRALTTGQPLLWDSGRVPSPQSQHVPFAGKPATSAQRVYWRLRIWARDGNPSAWSQTAEWTVGLLAPSDWRAKWITAGKLQGPMFRKEFTVSKNPVRALAYFCGLGYGELHLNGERVGDAVLDPAQTDYEQRALYSVYDVTPKLQKGPNVLGFLLGKGFFDQDRVWGGMSYGRPAGILQLRVEYPNETIEHIFTDGSWKRLSGPIRSDNVYAGETFDARMWDPEWLVPGYDDRIWLPAGIADTPTPQLIAQEMPPIRVVETLPVVDNWVTRAGARIYDFGQNFAGWARVQVEAPAGKRIQLRYAETIDRDRQLDTASTGVFATGCEQTDTYISSGNVTSTGVQAKRPDAAETWEPRTTYHGFRYVEIQGPTPDFEPKSVTGVVVHTDAPRVGQFACSDAMLNKLYRSAMWTLRSNLHGIPTDCPAREKCGWLGDSHIDCELAMYNFDLRQFYPKYIDDILTSAHGQLPSDVAPGKRITNPNGNPDWGSAIVLLPWHHYRFYGDRAVLQRYYPHMLAFVKRVAAKRKDGLVDRGYGDWCPPGSVTPIETPPVFTSTALLAESARCVAEAAAALGNKTDADEMRVLRSELTKSLAAKFHNKQTGHFGSQTANVMAAALDLGGASKKDLAWAIATDIVQSKHGHHSTGIMGSRYLYHVLTENGFGEIALAMLRRTDYPSYGHLFELGATTFWENWGEPELDAKWGTRSLNHPMQAAMAVWFFDCICGIRPILPGFKTFEIRPHLLSGLDWARAVHECGYGKIDVMWNREGDDERLDVHVPANTVANVVVPVANGGPATIDGKPIERSPWVKELVSSRENTQVTIGSGAYVFRWTTV